MALRLLALLAAARGAWRPQEELARLHGASFAASDAWRRVELELDRSLRAYDAVPSADAAATRAAEIFARAGRRVPCLAIAKQGGFNQTGVLIPNPYFAHVDEWDARVATWRAAIPAWDDRDPRLFWR
ncbi:hypothetical protein JL722_7176 [Aureococcus anophagefferens]|nr:hypothetical protein JL722_7176 [Aureococcus anophagefferens]